MAFPLVRGLLERSAVARLAATAILFSVLVCQPVFAQTPTIPYRDNIVRLLQQLVATGYPLDNAHDDGEWLQAAVAYAIHMRDREIEHLAIRAAFPIRARVTRPVSAIGAPAGIEILSYKVLTLPKPVAYSASFEASLDGGPYVDVGAQASGTHGGIRLEQLGAGALRPGTHLVRLRAFLVFGDPEQPFHTETRELAPIAYALYDETRAQQADARWFIESPVTLAASDIDPLLPQQPFYLWLSRALATRAELAEPWMWTSRYCSELTEEHHGTHDAGGICTVIPFSNGASIGQIWFRTGHVEISEAGATWYPAERPWFEALFLSGGRAVSRLSALPSLLDQPYEEYPRDRTLAVPEIVVTPAAPKRGAPAKLTVTLYNSGEVALQNVLVEVVQVDGETSGGMRHFVIDIPAFSYQSVSLDVTFRSGYGLVFALPFIKGHGLVHDVLGLPLEGTCVIHSVNPAAAPRDYIAKIAGHKPECIQSR